ncbi:hypothetical protein [Thermococcus sp.]
MGVQKLGFEYGDALAGLIVAFFLVKVAFSIILENLGYLTGQVIILSSVSVPGVHDLRARYVGSRFHPNSP